ncbi:hypothetical protein [Catellatospora methionotrophica]|uniref:hypothetical protein n=1 Tax=Catellatospora methionotrophica TaxID=121620 RepID=UPI0033CF7770
MVDAGMRDFLAALAATAGALTGLLFVALSVSPSAPPGPLARLVRQVRAGAALIAFTNALAVSLYGLVPGTNLGHPAVVLGVIGILFCAAGVKSMRAVLRTARQWSRQVGLIVLLMAIFGVELAAGLAAVAGARTATPLHLIGYTLVTSLIVGVARAWELVGERDTGLFASLAVLLGRTPPPPYPLEDPPGGDDPH